MPRFLVCLLIGALCGLSTPRPARADSTATSSVAQLLVLEPGDPSFRLFHGAVWLDHDKASWSYRWGGLQCRGRELSDTTIQLLFAAFRSEYQVTLEYVATDYNGKPFRCVTGVRISKS